MLQRRTLYVAKTKSICCKDEMYMLLRQNVYVAKTKFICYKDKFICYKDKSYILYRQNLYVAKTKSICCKDRKSTVLGLSAPAGAVFLPNRDILISGEHNIAVSVL